MITLTKAAIKQIKTISSEEDIGHLKLRIGVKGGGCAGLRHEVFFEDRDPFPTDLIIKQDGITVIIDPASLQFLEGTEIDYFSDLMKSGFKFNNDKIKSTCGCGKSFAV